MDENRSGRRRTGQRRWQEAGILPSWGCWWWALIAFGFALGTGVGLRAAEADPAGEAFDGAARLYEQGKFREAAAAYEKLASQGAGTVSVLFNQGNAWFKAGEKGRAIACYRQAQKLAPRDPEISANLDTIRGKVGSSGAPRPGAVDRFLALLTPNEWAAVALIGVWVWFGLMMAREWAPKSQILGPSAGWILAAGVAVLMAVAYGAKARDRRSDAVVIASEATVRFGPLEEAQAAFTLPDGAELRVTDRKGAWVEVRDGTGRRGWIGSRNLAMIP